MQEKTFALVLAAGKGTRMPSAKPKVLQKLLGDSMLSLVHYALTPSLDNRIFTLVGYEKEQVLAELKTLSIQAFNQHIVQTELLGTGHALQTALPTLKASRAEYVLLINADVPLIQPSFIEEIFTYSKENKPDLLFVSIEVDDIAQYGRVIRDPSGKIQAIIEKKDYDIVKYGNPSSEINAGLYLISLPLAEELLPLIQTNNASKEYYLTDLIALAIAYNKKVIAYNAGKNNTLLGANNPWELSEAEEILRDMRNKKLMNQGVILHNPGAVTISHNVEIEQGVEIQAPCEIYGQSKIGTNTSIGSHCVISNASIRNNNTILPYTHIDSASIAPNCQIGPYARIRPKSQILEGSHIGNFVETKNTIFGPHSKANHLTYLGDAEVGQGSNIGAGTITCNYDGKNKFKTIIGARNFIGSNTALVAPVKLGDDVFVGAGSVVTKDAEENQLIIARARQVNLKRRN